MFIPINPQGHSYARTLAEKTMAYLSESHHNHEDAQITLFLSRVRDRVEQAALAGASFFDVRYCDFETSHDLFNSVFNFLESKSPNYYHSYSCLIFSSEYYGDGVGQKIRLSWLHLCYLEDKP